MFEELRFFPPKWEFWRGRTDHVVEVRRANERIVFGAPREKKVRLPVYGDRGSVVCEGGLIERGLSPRKVYICKNILHHKCLRSRFIFVCFCFHVYNAILNKLFELGHPFTE